MKTRTLLIILAVFMLVAVVAVGVAHCTVPFREGYQAGFEDGLFPSGFDSTGYDYFPLDGQGVLSGYYTRKAGQFDNNSTLPPVSDGDIYVTLPPDGQLPAGKVSDRTPSVLGDYGRPAGYVLSPDGTTMTAIPAGYELDPRDRTQIRPIIWDAAALATAPPVYTTDTGTSNFRYNPNNYDMTFHYQIPDANLYDVSLSALTVNDDNGNPIQIIRAPPQAPPVYYDPRTTRYDMQWREPSYEDATWLSYATKKMNMPLQQLLPS